MSLKLVEFLDYSSNYAYSPGHSQATINTDHIVRAVQIRPENTRSSYEIVRLTFVDGKTLDVIGKATDFVEVTP